MSASLRPQRRPQSQGPASSRAENRSGRAFPPGEHKSSRLSQSGRQVSAEGQQACPPTAPRFVRRSRQNVGPPGTAAACMLLTSDRMSEHKTRIRNARRNADSTMHLRVFASPPQSMNSAIVQNSPRSSVTTLDSAFNGGGQACSRPIARQIKAAHRRPGRGAYLLSFPGGREGGEALLDNERMTQLGLLRFREKARPARARPWPTTLPCRVRCAGGRRSGRAKHDSRPSPGSCLC